MKLVFTKKVASIQYYQHEAGLIVLDIDGEHVEMKVGDRFTMTSDMVVTAPKSAMEHIRRAYLNGGYSERPVN